MTNTLNSWGRGSGKTTDILRVVEEFIERYEPIYHPEMNLMDMGEPLEPPKQANSSNILLCLWDFRQVEDFINKLSKKYTLNQEYYKRSGLVILTDKLDRRFEISTCTHGNLETKRIDAGQFGFIAVDDIFNLNPENLHWMYFAASMYCPMHLYGTPPPTPLSEEWRRLILKLKITHKELLKEIMHSEVDFSHLSQQDYVTQILGYMLV